MEEKGVGNGVVGDAGGFLRECDERGCERGGGEVEGEGGFGYGRGGGGGL